MAEFPRTNEDGPGAPLHFTNTPQEAYTTIINYRKYRYERHFYDENGKKMTEDEFLETYLPTKDGIVQDTRFSQIDTFINQSSNPMTFSARPHKGIRQLLKDAVKGTSSKFKLKNILKSIK